MTRREEYAKLLEAMQDDQDAAVAELTALLNSDDMKTLETKLGELKDLMIPGNHFDQMLGSFIGVITQSRGMMNANAEFVAKQAASTTPASQQVIDAPKQETADQSVQPTQTETSEEPAQAS